MQQDEGFASEQQLEMIVVEYTPTATVKQYKPKQYTNNLKLVNSIPVNEKAIFINSELQNQHRSHFRSKYSSQIVYQVGDKPRKRSYGLIFDSNYEHANLQYVISEDLKHYQLYIKPDSNTNSHFQWFCFKVKNKMIKKTTFTIKNFLKENMLYRKGLKPYFKYLKSGQKYYSQLTTEVKYQKSSNEESDFYQLTFSFQFSANNDEVQFCSQPPYTYSRLQHIYNNSSFTRINISKTILGHNIDAFIRNQNSNYKAVVVVFARQHSGEPVGSWMMEGFANRLVEMPQEEVLWILVPMINIDGVVVGNNRTGLLGYDFNRHWYIDKDTKRYHLFPEIIGIMRYFKKKQKDFSKKIKVFIDLHGHSSQSGVFSYGPPHHKQSQYYQLSRFLPYLIHSKNPDFNLKHSHYELSPTKRYCARSIFFQRFGFPYSYTIQSSFGLYNNRNINEIDILKMGESICQATSEFIKIMLCCSSKIQIKEKIGYLMKMTEEERGGQNGSYYDDSNSQEEDDRVPARAQFQDKVVSYLTRNHKGKDLKTATQPQIISKSKIHPSLIEKPISHERTSSLHHRYKTDHNLLLPNPTDRQSSLSLPRIKKKYGSSQTPKQNSVLDYSFNNLSLSEIKQKLYCIRHSKLGKKLLIGTRF